MKKLYYYLDITAENCKVSGLLNGFPIYELNAPSPVNFSMPINSALIGRGNSLVITLTPSSYDEKINLFDFDYMSMKAAGSVKVYGEGDISAPENGERILEFELQGEPGTFSFDNLQIDFRSLFYDNPVIEYDEPIEKYALFLRDLFSQGEVTPIQNEFQPKLEHIAYSFFEDSTKHVSDFRGFMKNIFLPLEPMLDFDEFDLRLTPWCEKRIWEIGVGLKRELLVTREDKEGYEYAIKVFVAMVEGQLKVIR